MQISLQKRQRYTANVHKNRKIESGNLGARYTLKRSILRNIWYFKFKIENISVDFIFTSLFILILKKKKKI